MKNREYSRSTNISNASKIYDNLSDSNKLLIAAMMNTMLVLLQNMHCKICSICRTMTRTTKQFLLERGNLDE